MKVAALANRQTKEWTRVQVSARLLLLGRAHQRLVPRAVAEVGDLPAGVSLASSGYEEPWLELCFDAPASWLRWEAVYPEEAEAVRAVAIASARALTVVSR